MRPPTKITAGQLILLEVITEFRSTYNRLPYLYELCGITERRANHLHCVISNLVNEELLDYPDELLITPNMRDILELISEGIVTKVEFETILGLNHITVCKVIQEMRERDLLPEGFTADDCTIPTTFVKVCKDVFITTTFGHSKEEIVINLNGSSGYLKIIDDFLRCVIYYNCKAFEIELEPDEVDCIPSYKESGHGYTDPSTRNSGKVTKTYIRFHRY